MLGRMKHEGANITSPRDGRMAAYIGDDERGEYIYKFVFGQGKYNRQPAEDNFDLLDQGTLYVAKFTGDGTEDGALRRHRPVDPLTTDKESFVDGMSVADVLINTRLAADKVGPTRMDRPEDIERNPVNGRIYAALTNNSTAAASSRSMRNPLAKSIVRDTSTAR